MGFGLGFDLGHQLLRRQVDMRLKLIACGISATHILILTAARNMNEIFLCIRVDLLRCPTPPWALLPDLGRWLFRRPLFMRRRAEPKDCHKQHG
jgi:hypothetical protein